MSDTSQQHLELLQSLLPPGPAWNRAFESYNDDGTIATPRSNLTLLLGAFAQELSRIHERANSLVSEANPLLTYETMYAKYAEAGLPDSCSPSATTIEAMRLEILQRWSSVGGASVQFITALLNASGYTFTITEYLDQLKCGMPINYPISSELWAHTLTITITGVQEHWFRLNQGSAGDYLHTWESNSVFCYINKIIPAHVRVNYVLT